MKYKLIAATGVRRIKKTVEGKMFIIEQIKLEYVDQKNNEFTFQHSDSFVNVYNSLYRNQKRDGSKVHSKCERDFSKYHYYDKYFF